MNNYTAPQRDMKFALYDVLESEKLFAELGIANADRELMDAVLEEAAKFTQTILAPLNAVGDEVGCVHDKNTGAVATPPVPFRQKSAPACLRQGSDSTPTTISRRFSNPAILKPCSRKWRRGWTGCSKVW